MVYTFTANNGTKVDVPEDHINPFSMDDVGYCIECGCDHYGVEPDARKYTCEYCEKDAVYGAEELMLQMMFNVK